MHLASELVEEARREGGDICEIEAEVGELAPITCEELLEALSKLVDWQVRLSEKQACVKCGCGFAGRPSIVAREHDLVLFKCPKCGRVPKVLEGDAIILKAVLKGGK